MDSRELQRAYGDSHTLERPTEGEPVHPYNDASEPAPAHPLDAPGVLETAHCQAWGN